MNKYLNAYLELLREIEIVGTEKPFLSKNMNNNLVILHELVDMVTPQKPLLTKSRLSDCEPVCPVCSNVVMRGYKHCQYCGQRLDWSEDE